MWRKIKEFATKKLSIQLEKLLNQWDRVARECLEASQPKAISDMKNSKINCFQPAGVAMTGFQLSEYGKVMNFVRILLSLKLHFL